MNFISDMSWTQLLLIEAGVVLQVVALRAIMKKTSTYCDGGTHREEEDEAGVPISKNEKKNLELAALYRPEQVSADTVPRQEGASDLRAGFMAKTAKVKFQNFKFRPH
jgi:hypothetical protein